MRMRKENRGLTLVELMLTFAILSIVLTVATSFMVTGSRSFTKGSADSDLQKEAELTVNQIEDMVIDVNGGLTMTDDADKAELVMYHSTQEPDETGTLETKYIKESVVWEKSGDAIRYSKWNVTYDEGTKTYMIDGAPLADNQLLAERVSLFEVDLDTVDETASDGTIHQIIRSVQIRVGYEHSAGNVDYATSPVITLRNRMLLSGDPAEIFVEPPTVSAKMKLYYCGDTTEWLDKPIEDRVSEVNRGFEYKITAKLETGSTPVSNDLLDWEIEETNRKSSITSEGRLAVDANESNDYLSIVARYKTNPNKYARGVVKVIGGSSGDGKSLTAVTITPRWPDNDAPTTPFEPLFGSYPTLEGDWSPEEIKRIQYTWSFDVPERVEWRSPDEQREKTGQFATLDLKIKQEKDNYGKILTIWLTAYSPDTGDTVVGEYKYWIDPEGTVGGDSTMQRGLGVSKDGVTTGHNKINYVFDTEPSDRADIRAFFCDQYGNERTDINHDEYLALDNWNRWTAYYTLSFKRNLPMDQDYYVKVVANFEKDVWEWDPDVGNNVIKYTKKWKYERIHHIPGVQMYDYHMTTGNKKGEFGFYFGLVAYWNVALGEDVFPTNEMFGFEVVDLKFDGPENAKLNVDFGGPVSTVGGADDMMYAWGNIYLGDTNNGALPDYITPKSMKVKLYMKQYENVCTYITIYFDN